MEEVEQEDSLSEEPGITSFPQWQNYKQLGEMEAGGVHLFLCHSPIYVDFPDIFLLEVNWIIFVP